MLFLLEMVCNGTGKDVEISMNFLFYYMGVLLNQPLARLWEYSKDKHQYSFFFLTIGYIKTTISINILTNDFKKINQHDIIEL